MRHQVEVPLRHGSDGCVELDALDAVERRPKLLAGRIRPENGVEADDAVQRGQMERLSCRRTADGLERVQRELHVRHGGRELIEINDLVPGDGSNDCYPRGRVSCISHNCHLSAAVDLLTISSIKSTVV